MQYFCDQASEVKSFHAIVNDIKKQDENNFFMVFHLGNGEPFSHEKCDKIDLYLEAIHKVENIKKISVHDKFHRTLILSGFCLLKIAKISLNSSFFPKPIKR